MTLKLLKTLVCALLFAILDLGHAAEPPAGAAAADKVYVGLHTFSAHLPAKDYQNNDNFGVYYRDGPWQVGAYRNTLNRVSFYGGYVQDLPGGFGLMAGLVSGYQKKCHAVYTPYQQGYLGPEGIYYKTEYDHTRTDCFGSSRGAVTALLALSWAAPFKFWGAQPEVMVMPPFPKHSAVVHAALRWEIK
jgi:hypothetical protein